MPLLPTSPNVEAPQAVLEEKPYSEVVDTNVAVQVSPSENRNVPSPRPSNMSAPAMDCRPQPSSAASAEMMPPSSGSGSEPLPDAGASVPAQSLPSLNITPPAATSTQPTQPPLSTKLPVIGQKNKRKAPTEEQEKEREEKKRKQEDAAAEKAKIAAEKERIRAMKAAEKAKVDAAKEAKRLKKQEEEQAAKAKTEKQQNLMASYFQIRTPVAASKQSNPFTATGGTTLADPSTSAQEAEPTKSAYELNFQPFFVKPGVTMAPPPFEMDDETKGVKSAILDEFMRGERGVFEPKRPFDAAETFDFPFPPRRGFVSPSVRKLMEGIHGESQNEKAFNNAQTLLKSIPMKYLYFHEDVRPAYLGTVTKPMTSRELRKISRRPTGKVLKEILVYEEDSEAEWAEDDGEDLDDAEDEEEELDGDEEMDDFVDDSEAVNPVVRLGFDADSLPISSGLCFENEKRKGPSITMRSYQLELLLDSPELPSTIDPFSTEYWPSPTKKPALAPPTASSAQTFLTPAHLTSAPRDALFGSSPSTAPGSDLKDGVPPEILEEFKRALISDECKDFSKATVIELLTKKFTSCTKLQVKTTLDLIAHRVTPTGQKKSVKQWALLPNFAPK